MKLFDCHYHLPTEDVEYGIYTDGRNVIFNYIEEYKVRKSELKETDFSSLIFDFKKEFDFIKSEVETGRISALKVHSRVQELSNEDYPSLFTHYEGLETNKIPVIFDAFYFGADLQFQPNLSRIAEFAQLFKDTKVVVAHCGGIKVLEYFLHLKELPNVYFDLSFSLAYLSKTSIYQDFKNLLQYASADKLMFGTDFPFISAANQLEHFWEIANSVKLTDEKLRKILYQNGFDLFSNK